MYQNPFSQIDLDIPRMLLYQSRRRETSTRLYRSEGLLDDTTVSIDELTCVFFIKIYKWLILAIYAGREGHLQKSSIDDILTYITINII